MEMFQIERRNTEPLMDNEEFSDLLTDCSFNDRLGNSDIVDIMNLDNSPSKWCMSPLIACKQEIGPGWDHLDHITQAEFRTFDENALVLEDTKLPKRLLQCEGDSDVDQDSRLPSLGLESWAGPMNFSINFKSTKFSNSKWCYNSDINKLYIMRTASVPVEISMDSWNNYTLNITPVFLKSQYISDPVLRCHNHRIADESLGCENPDHIIEVVNPEAKHITMGERFSVEIPVGRPAPGETSKIIHIMSRCWNTCVGSSKRSYCLIFTLFSSNGREIGRQVVQFKSCQSPTRDMSTEMKKLNNAAQPVQVKRKAKGVFKLAKKAKAGPSLASSTSQQIGVENLVVLSEIAPDVKKYINGLMAERFARKDKHFIPPYPEV